MKYHIKPLAMTKPQGFHQDLYGYDLFPYPWMLRENFSGMTKSLKIS